MSKKIRVAWLPGDGVGKETMEAARIVLDAVGFDAEIIHGDIGWDFWCSEGNPLPQRTVDLLKNTDVCLFGAITSKPKEEAQAELVPELQGKGLIYRSPIVSLRQTFNLHTNLRPCRSYPGNPCNFRDDINLVVFRENTEDLYAGVEWHPIPEAVRATLNTNAGMKRFTSVANEDMAVSCRVITRHASRVIVDDAFKYARANGFKQVCVVEKPNVVRETSGLFVRTAREVAKDYPEIELREDNIDAMCMWLVKNPQNYGVIVTSNMFGDILSDLAAQLIGGLGFSAAGNIGDNYAVFEPTHGSAPKYTGQYKVNPIATIQAAKMMLEWLGIKDKAENIDQAIAKIIREGKVRTYDMVRKGEKAVSTLEMGQAVAKALQ